VRLITLKKSSDFSKRAFRVARTRDRLTEGYALYQLRQRYSWVKNKKLWMTFFRT